MKEKILFVAGNVIYNNDGYKSRIEMEMDILSEFELHILIPNSEKNIQFRNNVIIHHYEEGLNNRIIHKFHQLNLFKRIIKKVITENHIRLVICEGLGAAIKSIDMIKKLGIYLVFDCHGTEPEEFYLYHKNLKGYLWSRFLKKCEKIVVRRSSYLVTVTKKQYESWKISKKYFVLPMLPANHFMSMKNMRQDIRKKLNILDDEIAFVYSGGNEKWQMSEQTLRCYKTLEENFSNVRLFIFSHAVEEFESIIMTMDIKNCKIFSIKYGDMPFYLDACDFGFCLRENNIINKVASPTKILEYMSRNVMPILTNHVGDFSELLANKKLAYILQDDLKFKEFPLKENYSGKEYVHSYSQEIKLEYLAIIRKLVE